MNIVDMADPISMWVNCKGRAGVGVEMQLLSEPVSRFSGVNNAFPSSLPIATLAKFQGNGDRSHRGVSCPSGCQVSFQLMVKGFLQIQI